MKLEMEIHLLYEAFEFELIGGLNYFLQRLFSNAVSKDSFVHCNNVPLNVEYFRLCRWPLIFLPYAVG